MNSGSIRTSTAAPACTAGQRRIATMHFRLLAAFQGRAVKQYLPSAASHLYIDAHVARPMVISRRRAAVARKITTTVLLRNYFAVDGSSIFFIITLSASSFFAAKSGVALMHMMPSRARNNWSSLSSSPPPASGCFSATGHYRGKATHTLLHDYFSRAFSSRSVRHTNFLAKHFPALTGYHFKCRPA